MSDHHSDHHCEHQSGTDALDALVERVLDLAVYAPVGVAVTLRDELPRHVKQGRQALENRIQLARFIGQLAVQTGQRELQKRIEQQREARRAQTDDSDDAGDPGDAGDAGPADRVDAPEFADAEPSAAAGRPAIASQPSEPSTSLADDTQDDSGGSGDAGDAGHVPAAAELPISDYESLPAINVVDRLRSMSPDEIDLVRRFEQAHRARRTILAKIDQLQERHAAE